MSSKFGGISIFLAVTFLSLIVFVMSIVEVTRVQIIRAQAERMVISATQSILAGYDSALKNEYGIFARNPSYGDRFFVDTDLVYSPNDAMRMDFEYYLSENVQQTSGQLHMSLIDRYVFRYEDTNYYEMAPLSLVGSPSLRPKTLVTAGTKDLSYVKEDMMAYMESRLPFIGLTAILDTFGAAEKLGRTTTFIEGKNEQIEEAASIETLYLKLYATMDGVSVNPENNSLSVADTRWVNRLKTSEASYMLAYEGITVAVGQTPSPEEPLVAIKAYQAAYELMVLSAERLAEGYGDYETTTKALRKITKNIKGYRNELVDVEATIEAINLKIEDKVSAFALAEEGAIGGLSAEINVLAMGRQSLYEQVVAIERTVAKLEDEQDGLTELLVQLEETMTIQMTLINHQQTIIDGHIRTIQHLTVGTDNYLQRNREAKELLDQIQAQAASMEASINQFIELSEQNEDAYIEATYQQGIHDLESLKDSYGVGSDLQTAFKGNLTEIQKTVVDNIEILEQVSGDVDLLGASSRILVGVFNEAGIDRGTLINLKNISGINDFYVDHLSTQEWQDQQPSIGVRSSLEDIAIASNAYKIAPLLDYSGFNQSEEAVAEKSRFRDMINGMKSFLAGYELDQLTSRYNPKDVLLPEGMISELMGMVDKAQAMDVAMDYDEEDYQGGGKPEDDQVYMAAGRSSGTGAGLLTDAKAHLLLNEYAIGMFRSFPETKRDEETLSGYAMKSHPYETELEYIYTGIKDSDQALMQVALQIFAVRTAFNIVHLSTDAVKRGFITKVAAAIAGPISAGVLTVVVALFVGLLWATIESLVDLEQLLSGKKVPLLKTSGTWFTSPEGLVDLSIDTVSTVTLEYSARFIEAVSDKTQKQLTTLKGQVNEATGAVVDQELNQLYEQLEVVTDGAVDAFDQVYNQALEAVLLSYREAGDQVHGSDFLSPSSPGYEVVATGIETLQDVLDQGVDHGYVELIKAKNQVVEAQMASLEQVKTDLAMTIKKEMNEEVDALFTDINEAVETMADKGEEASAAMITKQLESYRKSLNEKAGDYTKDISTKGAKADPTTLIPSIDYEMYLRLFMMADGEHLDNRVARMLDLIDYNLIYGKKGSVSTEDLMLKDYVYSLEGEAAFKVDYLFLDLPLPAIKMKPTDTFFTIEAKVVNGYED